MAITVKHSKVSTIPDTDDTSLVRPSDWNADHTLTGTIDIANGGTGATTATGAINNLLPTQTGQSGKYLGTDGTNPQWLTAPTGGGGSSVSYYLNGGTNQGTFGGNTYYQMSKTAVTGTSVNFTIATNGYIAQFLTDANDPALLNIPAGNWNFEMFFSSSSAGGTPSFYVELYKYNGTTFTLISSGSTSPESITGGTVKDVYTTALAVPATSLSLTDRLAVRVYVNNSGRTITLYTQDANLCQVITTFSTGITALNGLTAQVQNFATGTTGSDFNISSATSTHTFNIPSSSASNRGLLTSADWTTFNSKANAFTYTTNYIPYGQGTTTPTQSANLTFNGTTLIANDITDSSLTSGRVTYAGTGGNLRDASNFTYDGTNLIAGAIQNTPIGSTTPSSIVGTTITGQTARLNGTGQNLIAYSNNFVTGWSNGAITVTGSQSDPVGGSTASLLVPTVTNTAHYLANSTAAFSSGTTFTISVYVKASGYTLFYISDATAGTFACSYNLTAVTATPNTGCTGTITAVTGATGWYRLTLTTTGIPTSSSRATITPYASGATLTAFGATFAGDGTSGAFVYGTQVELGSTANTYIPTTTTAVYGTPTLSFSGVSTLGLESNGALFLQPAGTGAIQAQATTSTSAGGNARGANAVDWQTLRGSATQVASGAYSVLGGGQSNQANGFNSTIAGGNGNQCGSSIGFIGGGASNNGNGSLYTAIVGGQSNTAAGYYNFIGAGFTNSGTSSSAVTTQSGTMNATTAVTLSGSNANIKVGQYITGTSIAGDTYVAAISGTSLTLSKNASGSSTSTLSFFTPHGVVVGGGNNQATGSYSFIGGGGDAGTAANRNVASGDWSFVGGGRKNTASGAGSVVAGGGFDGTNVFANTASGAMSFIGSGLNNLALGYGSFVAGGASNITSGVYTVVGGGNNNTANAYGSTVVGGQFGTTRAVVGNIVFPACNLPLGATLGISQSSLLILAVQTTDATATALRSDANAAGTTNQVILPNNSAYYFKIEVIAGVTGAGNTKAWELKGAIKRGANAASTTLVGSVTTTVIAQDAGASAWTLTATADTTNGGISVTATGQASTTIRWVARVTTTEMTF